MNVIFQFKATAPFTPAEQAVLDNAKYSFVPQMKIIETVIKSTKKNVPDTILKTIPYQATVDKADYNNLLALLKSKGTVTVIGTWNDDGTLISYDEKLYRDALLDIENLETAVFLNGVDYTGKEATFKPIKSRDENGKLLKDINGKQLFDQPSRREFKRVKSKRRPTIAEAKKTNLVIFTGTNLRQL